MAAPLNVGAALRLAAVWGEHIHQCQRVGKLDGVQASEQIMRFGEAGGQVRALAKHRSGCCGRVRARDELRGTGNSVLRVVHWLGGPGSSGRASEQTWRQRRRHTGRRRPFSTEQRAGFSHEVFG